MSIENLIEKLRSDIDKFSFDDVYDITHVKNISSEITKLPYPMKFQVSIFISIIAIIDAFH